MSVINQTSSKLPQGFSVFQPTLGAQLQFLPAIGTRELDELINAYVAGPASTQEKRASVSLDFLEYAHVTGQTFKFYPVYSMTTSMESPVTASPLQDSGYGSSFNPSPVMSNWDWSQVPGTLATSQCSSTASQKSRHSSKAAVSRHTATDFSHLPGMKILTKDGMDVTNSASRGSKTKEQRDHAHLMRIIKACDSCRRKKIRCDPSHKKRGVSTSQAQPATKVGKKSKPVVQKAQAAVPSGTHDELNASLASFAVDITSATEWDSLVAPVPTASESWEEFIDYPPAEDYDFFNDPEGYLSPLSSSQSAYSTKSVTPASDQGVMEQYNPGTAEYLSNQQPDAVNNYVDFNLFSPSSSFSEDDCMVPIELSKQTLGQSRLLSSLQPSPNPLPPTELSSDNTSYGGTMDGDRDDQFASFWPLPQYGARVGESRIGGTYVDPDPAMNVNVFDSPGSSRLTSDCVDHSLDPAVEVSSTANYSSGVQPYLESNVRTVCPNSMNERLIRQKMNTSHNSSVAAEDEKIQDVCEPFVCGLLRWLTCSKVSIFADIARFRRRDKGHTTHHAISTTMEGVCHPWLLSLNRRLICDQAFDCTSVDVSHTARSRVEHQSLVELQSIADLQQLMSGNVSMTERTSSAALLSSPMLSAAENPISLSPVSRTQDTIVSANTDSNLHDGSSLSESNPDSRAELYRSTPRHVTTTEEFGVSANESYNDALNTSSIEAVVQNTALVTASSRRSVVSATSAVSTMSRQAVTEATNAFTVSQAESQDAQTRPTACSGEYIQLLSYMLYTTSALMSVSSCLNAGIVWPTMLSAAVAIFTLAVWSSGLKQLSAGLVRGRKAQIVVKEQAFLSKAQRSKANCWRSLRSLESQSLSAAKLVNHLVPRSGRFVMAV